MKPESSAESHREADKVGRGDPAGLLRRPAPRNDTTLWLWVGGGFLLLVVAWSVLFTVARKTKVESVPLATEEARP